MARWNRARADLRLPYANVEVLRIVLLLVRAPNPDDPAHRNLVLDDLLRSRVLACTNVAQLERWFDRALAATTLADVFTEP